MATEQPSAPAPVPSSPVEASPVANTDVDLSCKAFVGNLSFGVTHDQLKDFFSPAGQVTRVDIITRGTRSLGYGFITFESEDAVKKAVTDLNKKELDGREVNIEHARPQEKKPPRPRKATKSDVSAGENTEPIAEDGTPARKPKPRRFKNRKTNRRRKDASAPGEDSVAPEAEAEAANADADGQVANGNTSSADDAGKPKGKGFRRRKFGARRFQRTPRQHSGEPSKTDLFVANLPYSIDDDGLKEIFAEFDVKVAHVNLNRYTNRSKGYGFVEFADETEQQKALEAVNGKVVQERELTVKVALGKPPRHDAESEGEDKEKGIDQATAVEEKENAEATVVAS